ncbi:RagB/SusD family nutrient uptake outer membrane protein [Fulvitalea axinellae]
MKKYTKLWICLLAFGMLSLGSCSDFFEPDQDMVLEKKDHWDTHEKVRRGLIGAYSELQDVVEEMIVLGGVRADLLTVTENFDADLKELNEHNIGRNNSYVDPRPFYDVITNCNELIANVDKALVDPKFSEELRDAYKAEAIVLRAWTYFQLAQTFKTVPVITDPLGGIDGEYEPDMLNLKQMVNWLTEEVIKVADAPKLVWGEDISDQVWDRVFVNRNALLGELHLVAGNYQNAADHFYSAIITDGGGKDDSSFKCNKDETGGSWSSFWFVAGSGSAYLEQVTVIPFSAFRRQTNEIATLFSSVRSGKYLLKPSENAIENWTTEVDTPRDPRGLFGSYGVIDKRKQVTKYSSSTDDVFSIYRAADLHLLYAEAINRAGNPDEALDVINDKLRDSPKSNGIRGRVGLPKIDLLQYAGMEDTPQNLDKLEEVERLLLEERARELAFEGRRWNTLVRFATRSTDPSILADRIAIKFEKADLPAEGIRTKLSDPENWRIEFNMNFLKNN